MSAVEIVAGTVELVQVYAAAAAGGALSGSSNLRVQVRRGSDGYLLDFNDGVFKNTGWTTLQATLGEVDASNDPGWYQLSGGLDTTGWATTSYYLTFVELSTSLVAGGPQFATGEIRIVTATPSTLSVRIPAALEGGRMAASIVAGGITATEAPALANLDVAVSTRAAPGAQMDLVDDAIDAGAVAASGVSEIQTGLASSSEVTAVGVAVAALPSDADNAAAVWAAGARTLTGIGSSGIASQASVDALPTASGIASAVWATALPGAFSAGQAGYLMGTYLDAAVSSRLASGSYTAAPTASQVATQVLGTAVPGAFGTGSLGYLVGTNLDVQVSTRLPTSSYAAAPTASATADAVCDELLSGHQIAGSVGAALSAASSGADPETIAAAVWATVLSNPNAGTAGRFLQRLFQLAFNKSVLASTGGGLITLYDDDGTTPLLTIPVRDVGGNAIAIAVTTPAQRGPAVES